MNTEFIAKRINEYQENPILEPLRCENKSSHRLLKAFVENEKVMLKCAECDYVETDILPFFTLDDYEEKLLEEMRWVEELERFI